MPVQTLDLWELSVGSPEGVDLGAVGSENLVQKEEKALALSVSEMHQISNGNMFCRHCTTTTTGFSGRDVAQSENLHFDGVRSADRNRSSSGQTLPFGVRSQAGVTCSLGTPGSCDTSRKKGWKYQNPRLNDGVQ
ncbi:hypothetical protein RUM43_002404 [Polyplax serrata]|uniref:Uncharacterized protein n=1 Tax=Polyplax serrata TaxID=468196 RepID=A0AAN8NTB6_POLSC